MKILVLVRHAKSDWGYEFLNDIDRPLNERGYRDAYQLSKWYAEHYTSPDRMITSPAIRAISTALIFSRTLKYNEQDILIRHGIYNSTTDDFLSVTHSVSNDIKSVMIFGHNPIITSISNLLNKNFYVDNIPTCGIIILEFNTDRWEKIGQIKANKIEHQFVK